MLKPVKILHLSAAESMLNPNLREQLCDLRNAGYEIHTASIDGLLARRLQLEDGFPWTALPLTREVNPWSDWRALRFITRFMIENRFEIVHTHTPKGNLIGQWAARRAHTPIVLQTLHGFYLNERMPPLQYALWRSIERRSASFSDVILCQNIEDIHTAVSERIAVPTQLRFLGNGINLQQYSSTLRHSSERAAYRRTLKIAPDALTIGMCARLTAEKGYLEFCEAGQILLERYPHLHLLMIGQTVTSERKQERWKGSVRIAQHPRVTILRDRIDMPELYRCMDIHVLPSHREGFPRVLMEGAASSLPQVATQIRGCRQAVEHERTGLLVPVGDVPALTAALQRLIETPDLRKAFGQAAYEKAQREFDQQRVFEIVKATYAELLAVKKR